MAGVLLMACNELIDVDRFMTGQGSGGGASAMACGTGAVCLPALPLGWRGPIVVVQPSGRADGCSGDFPTEVFRGDASVQVPPLECSCVCQPATGQSCPSPQFYNYANNGCTPTTNGNPLTPGSCVSSFSPSPPAGGSVRVDGGTALGGSCVPTPEERRPPITSERRIACEGSGWSQASCSSDQMCVPIPSEVFLPRLCIWTEGTLPCPSDAGFSEETIVLRGGYEDQRACSECICGPPSAGKCIGSSEIFAQQSCGAKKADMPHDGTRVTLTPSGFSSVRLQSSTLVPGTCEASNVQPVGEVEGRNQATVCCTPSLE